MKTARIVLCIAAIAPSMLLAAKTEAPEQAPKSAIVAPVPATPPAATAPADAAPAMPPNVNRPPKRPGFSGILDVTRDAESKITKITLKISTNLTYVVKKDEQSLKLAESAAGKRVRIIGKLVDEVVNNETNTVLKVDTYAVAPPRGIRPPTIDMSGDKSGKTTTPASTDHAPAVPAAAVTPPAPAAPATPAPTPEAPKK